MADGHLMAHLMARVIRDIKDLLLGEGHDVPDNDALHLWDEFDGHVAARGYSAERERGDRRHHVVPAHAGIRCCASLARTASSSVTAAAHMRSFNASYSPVDSGSVTSWPPWMSSAVTKAGDPSAGYVMTKSCHGTAPAYGADTMPMRTAASSRAAESCADCEPSTPGVGSHDGTCSAIRKSHCRPASRRTAWRTMRPARAAA